MARTNLDRGESRESHWRQVLAKWSASGQTQASFCRQRLISVTALRWWKSELARRDGRTRRGQRRSKTGTGFVPVQLVAGPLPAATSDIYTKIVAGQ